MSDTATPVQNPTFLGEIRYFFEQEDIEHMKKVSGLDLATYEGVKANATQIYFQTSGGSMPPDPKRRWSVDRVETFKNWIVAGYPMGEAPTKKAATLALAAAPADVRPDAGSLTQEQIALVAKAFAGMMARDPIFWFFHCNWERNFFAWQTFYDAVDLTGFRKLLDQPSPIWLDTPPFNALDPFGKAVPDVIDASGSAYEALPPNPERPRLMLAAIPMARSFRLQPSADLSVRVKRIARLEIEGSFVVHLQANGKTIGRRAVFQSNAPNQCPGCVERSEIDVTFRVPRKKIADKTLEVKIETLAPDRIDQWVPLSQVGSPTVNVRELLANE